jgi:Predicted enzyme involved in methoxymalonyl-ACP biosynthesis
MAKLLIWDLDDTLWAGTLAEGDSIVLFEERANYIRSLNKRGVVNSICSKNDYNAAKSELEKLGLWDEFVFPAIDFSSKGKLVSQIIADMQLRAPDVVFFDDNELNLREVEFENPGIVVVDSRGDAMDVFLAGLEEKLKDIKKSRVEEYRILERKRTDRIVTGADNEHFLASCGIKVALLRRSDNLPYAHRIEELINRTNQLNFTKSRIPPGEISEYIVDVSRNETYSVFVWDNYGYYGLVGFAAIEQRKLLRHFLFRAGP